VDESDAGGSQEGHQQRLEDEDGGGRIDQTADDDEEDVDGEQDAPLGQLQAVDEAGDGLRNAQDGEEPSVEAGAGHNDHDLRGQQAGAARDRPDVAPARIAVDVASDGDATDGSNAGGLRRR